MADVTKLLTLLAILAAQITCHFCLPLDDVSSLQPAGSALTNNRPDNNGDTSTGEELGAILAKMYVDDLLREGREDRDEAGERGLMMSSSASASHPAAYSLSRSQQQLDPLANRQSALTSSKRFSEFLGGKRKRFSEFLGGKKRFSEFLGGKKRSSEEMYRMGSNSKRFSEFLGGKRGGESFHDGGDPMIGMDSDGYQSFRF
jgi:hypothetical protein